MNSLKKQKFPESIKCYTEAILRNPKDPNLYSNRATSYIKLAEYSYALKDIDKSLSFEPKNVKYLQKKKAQIEYFSKQYHKALDTLKIALELDPENKQLLEAYYTVSNAAQNPEYDEERVEKAKNDPEIKMILNDVTIMKVLEAAKTDSSAIQRAMKDSNLRVKLEKLINSGIFSQKKGQQGDD